MARDSRPTLRCLVEDLKLRTPPLHIDLGLIAHPLLNEARRLAQTSPLGQKRILAIIEAPVFRLRVSSMRGATWVEADARLWLLAAQERRAGSRDDAYLYFVALSRRGRLFPAAEDQARLEAEEVAQRAGRLRAEVATICADLRREIAHRPEFEFKRDLVGIYPTRIKVIAGDPTQVWVAVSIFDASRSPYRKGWRTTIFAEFEKGLSPCEFDFSADFGQEAAKDWEEACLYLR
jgi:hypothetical protein